MQGFNMGRYVPPSLEGVASFNQASGKKAYSRNPDGSQTVRFECPFAIWCTHCQPETIIAQGVRFNAQKRKVGNYFSTPIWAFKIKHTVCGGWIEVRTDPKNTEYVVFEGGRRRDYGDQSIHIDSDGGAGLEIIAHGSRTGAGDVADVLATIEKKNKEQTALEKEKARIVELEKRAAKDWADPYAMNKKIRQDFRVERRARAEDRQAGEGLRDRFGLGLDLLPSTPQDETRAKLTDFAVQDVNVETYSNAVKKPMFDIGKSKGSTQVKSQQSSTRNNAPLQKVVLQTSLMSNSRLTSDPFLRSDQDWDTTRKRKREGNTALEESTQMTSGNEGTTGTLLVAYDSD